jgi:hypothetical protein
VNVSAADAAKAIVPTSAPFSWIRKIVVAVAEVAAVLRLRSDVFISLLR